MGKFTLCVAFIVALWCQPTPAWADPVRVTGGSFVSDFEGDFFTLVGESFLLAQVNDPATCCLTVPKIIEASCGFPAYGTGCGPGDVLNLSFRTPGETDLSAGRATINGTIYPDVTFRGSLDFRADRVTFPGTTADNVVLETPFTFEGLFRGFNGSTEVFTLSLFGRGTVHFPMERMTNGLYTSGDADGFVEYEFAQAAAVPEPISLMLVGTGLTLLGFVRRRARS